VSDDSTGLILVVEDDDALRTIIRLNLVKRGFYVREATTLREARYAFAEARPDVLLLDLNLSDGSGQDLLVDLHARGITQPTVVMSAAGISPLRLAQTQPVWYLAKPFRIEALLDVLALARSTKPAAIGRRLLDEAALELPAWTRELRTACLTLSRASSRAIRTMALSLLVATGPTEISPVILAARLAGEYGLAARSELVGSTLRVWLHRDDGGAVADGQEREPGAAIQRSFLEPTTSASGPAQDGVAPLAGLTEV
jgi:two-component system nitrogen regulation response regulator GlnG